MATLQEHQAVLLELLTEFDRVCRENGIRYQLFAGSALGAVRHQGFIPWDDDLDVVMLRQDYDRFLRIAPDQVGAQYHVQGEFGPHWPMHFSKLRKNGTTCLEKYHPRDPKIHQGIYMDIFPCDNLRSDGLLGKLQFLAARAVLAKTIAKRGYETDSLLKKVFMLFCRLLPLKPLHRFAIQRTHGDTAWVHTFFGGSCRFDTGTYPRQWLTESVEASFAGLTVPVSRHYDALLSTMYGDYMTLPPEEDRKCKVHGILVDTEKNYTEYEGYRDGMTFDGYTRSIR